MSHIQWPVVLFDMRGMVVHQNHASLDYMVSPLDPSEPVY